MIRFERKIPIQWPIICQLEWDVKLYSLAFCFSVHLEISAVAEHHRLFSCFSSRIYESDWDCQKMVVRPIQSSRRKMNVILLLLIQTHYAECHCYRYPTSKQFAALMWVKPGFHYPSWRPELTGDRFPLPVNTGRVYRRAFPLAKLHFLTPVNSGRQLG